MLRKRGYTYRECELSKSLLLILQAEGSLLRIAERPHG